MKVEYLYGTMIEVPRAAVTADEMAQTAEFFSFGTNDLTQMTFGYSRDDVEQLPARLPEEGNPRARSVPEPGHRRRRQADRDGRAKGRSTRPDLKCGICGEHGGDPKSVDFCHKVGLNYVSCSPFPRADRPPGRGPRGDSGGGEEVGGGEGWEEWTEVKRESGTEVCLGSRCRTFGRFGFGVCAAHWVRSRELKRMHFRRLPCS